MDLKIFADKNLFNAGTSFFKQLNIPLNSNTTTSLHLKDILKDKFKSQEIFKKVSATYFLGLVDKSVFDTSLSLFDDGNVTFDQAVEKIHADYEGMMIFAVLKEADEKFERYYEMKRLGYDLDTIEDRVCEIYKIEKEDLFSRSRHKVKSDARALFCFWAHRELGLAQRELARRLGMSQPGVGYAVIKGEAISKSNNYRIKN